MNVRPAAILLLLLTALPAAAGPVVQAFGGTAWTLPGTLTVSQHGYADLSHDARWETRPFQEPLYWALRLGWRRGGDGFELQLLHHKLYLTNPTPEITHLEVTHGFNLLTGHYVWRGSPLQLRAGAGVVLPKTDATVRGRTDGTTGYRIRGPVLLAGVGWEHGLAGGLFCAAEVQAQAAWAKVEIPDGEARVRSFSFSLLAGVGWAF